MFKILDKRLTELKVGYAEFAEIIAESPQTLNNWKRRGRIPGDKVKKVAAAAELDIDELLPGPTRSKIAERRGTYSSTVSDKITQQMLVAFADLPRDIQVHFLKIMEGYHSPAGRTEIDASDIEATANRNIDKKRRA